jgi:hypothetical protein
MLLGRRTTARCAGKPTQPVVSEEFAPPIHIDISAIPHRFKGADSVGHPREQLDLVHVELSGLAHE